MTLNEVRSQYPQYGDMSDAELAAAMHRKFYPDMSFEDFSSRIGYSEAGDITPEEPVDQAVENSTGSYQLDQMKMGIVDLFKQYLPDFALSSMGMQPSLKDSKQNPDGTFDMQDYRQKEAEMTDSFARENLGYQGVQPEGMIDTLTGAGARALVDPLALVGAKGPSTAAVELAHSYLSGVAGATASNLATPVVTDLTGSEMAGDMAGAFAASLAGAGVSAGRAATGVGTKTVKQVANKRHHVADTAEKASDYMATQEISTIIRKATEAQPDIDSVIRAAQELETHVPGLVIPPTATLSKNPIFRKNMNELLRRDPSFYAKVKKNMDDAVAAVDARRKQLFGESGDVADRAIRHSLPQHYGIKIKNAQKRIKAIDDKIEQLSSKIDSKRDLEGVGEAAVNLVRAKEAAVREKLSPQYEALISKAQANGVMMPPKSVGNIHSLMKLAKFEDTFATFPVIVNKVRRYWTPEKVKGPQLYGPKGEKLPRSTYLKYPEVSPKEVDSLKREVNKAIRQTGDRDKKRLLLKLKETLASEIQNMDASFADQYRALDEAYYTELGLPLSQAGLRQIDAAKFSTVVGGHLSKPEHVRDFLAFAGNDGIPIVRDAIMLRMRDSSILKADGSLNVNALRKYIRKNKKLINEVPGLLNELTDLSRVTTELIDTKARIEDAYTEAARSNADGIYQAFHNKPLSSVVREILSSPSASLKYHNDLGKLDAGSARMMRRAIRSEMVSQAMTSNKSMKDWMHENASSIDMWFGKSYRANLKSIAEASDILSRLDVDSMNFSVDFKKSDMLEDFSGTNMTQLQSILRDRITNAGTKLAIVGSRWSVKRANSKRDADIERLLLDPNALADLRQSIENAKKFDLGTGKFAKEIGSILVNVFGKGLYMGMQGHEASEEAPPTQ